MARTPLDPGVISARRPVENLAGAVCRRRLCAAEPGGSDRCSIAGLCLIPLDRPTDADPKRPLAKTVDFAAGLREAPL